MPEPTRPAQPSLPDDVFAELLSILDRDGDPTAALDALITRYPEHAAAIARHTEARSTLVPPPRAGGDRVQSTATDALMARLETAPKLDTQRYELEGEVDRGGMGAIVKIHDRHLNRHLAMKLLLEREPPRDEHEQQLAHQILGRFLEEAQVTSQLDHPGVVPVHELGLDAQGKVFFTMRLVRGRTAHGVFEDARAGADGWTVTRALEVILKVCDTMAFAHDKGVLHRDLKPANVMVGRFGEVYVMDWGLAKVLGQQDRVDVRIRPEAASALSQVESARQRDADREVSTSVVSMDGQRLGTPSYMPPEQARSEELDPRADVYAIGAMLYELLTGRAPYTTPGVRKHAYRILEDVADGPPKRLEELAQDVPAELVAVVEKAMARDRDQRYADTLALAADLRAYVDHRAVSAYRTGALVELRLWVRRNKPLAASLAAAVLILVAGVILTSKLARDKSALAAAEAKAANVAADRAIDLQKRTNEFDRLAQVVHLKAAIAAEKALYPAWPEQAAAMRAWQTEHAERLLASRPEVEATLRELRDRGLPLTVEDVEPTRHAPAALDGAEKAMSTAELNALRELYDQALAFPRVADPEERAVVDVEARGLAAALLAVEKSEGKDHALLDTLAWAYYACDRPEQALQTSARALALAPEQDKAAYRAARDRLRTAIEEKEASLLPQLEQAVQDLDAALSERTWRFANDTDEFLYGALTEVVEGIAAFEHEQVAGVAQRLSWAEQLDQLTRAHPNAQPTWDDARRALAVADGVVASTLYAEQPITNLQPQPGLVPIGMSPQTKLWEFYHLRSAWDPAGEVAPEDIPIPRHDPTTGEIEVTEATGIVFVLLPGASYLMGASPDPGHPQHDPQRASAETMREETLREETVGAVFLARHELTRAQWQRLSGGPDPGMQAQGRSYPTDPSAVGATHPVEGVSWDDCSRLLVEHGLRLPREAEWEYGCRAGEPTPWWTGATAASLDGAANVLDEKAAARYPQWGNQEGDFDDGWIGTAPVGTYRPNGFGLFDVHGNVWEWCADAYMSFSYRIHRGGSFLAPARNARSASSTWIAPADRDISLGVRPARALH